ncbi:hypothetical protein [Nodularia sp. UHCC 0506]|uniref:hypothetical protein n=1 Tax=Nodularia sp. UHCC 0506 TaxID=3110243 RepID=UPI002B200B22|nr:hypothetical protein [Nodularia sp. UHCC 0506]MEA5515288.1 hypothetical protein [Nodularia sp. UHCC 0506]
MSYVSLLKNIPEILSQPTGIAAIASLGIHGAIALIVPLMPVDTAPSPVSASPKSVGILELSQADQSRLPQMPSTFPSEATLQPELPQQPQLLSPNLNIQAQRTVLPPLPLSATPYRQSALPSFRTAPNYRFSPNRNVSLPQRQPTAMRESVRQSTARQTAPAVPREEFRFDPSGFNAANQRFTASTRTFNQSAVKLAVQPIPVDRLPKATASEIPGELPNTRRTNTATNTNPQITQPGNESLIARLQKNPQPQDEVALRNPNIRTSQPESIAKASDLTLKPVNEPQGLIAQLNSYESIRQEIQKAYPNSQEKPVIRETVAANKPNIQGTVLGFLVVDPEGKVLDIKFQDESVSSELKSKAREYFSTKSPKGDQRISSYPFSLRFQNDGKTAATTQEQSPAASLQPLPELRISNEESVPTATRRPEANNSSLSTTLESGQKLIQQLRQLQEERKESN